MDFLETTYKDCIFNKPHSNGHPCLTNKCFESQDTRGTALEKHCEGGFGNDTCQPCTTAVNQRYDRQIEELQQLHGFQFCNGCIKDKRKYAVQPQPLFRTVTDLGRFLVKGGDEWYHDKICYQCKYKLRVADFKEVNKLITDLEKDIGDPRIAELKKLIADALY